MEFQEKIYELSKRIKKIKSSVTTEEATKHSFVMPFIALLGYDVFDPTVVVPEFTADIGRKKNEKIDYAIMKDGNPLILIEVKTHTEKLDRHTTQLERYFSVTDCRFAILTNGIEYRFYSDIDHTNRMDQVPFLVLNMMDPKLRNIKKLLEFSKDILDVDKILGIANNQKYVMAIKETFKQEVLEPSDELARFFASKATDKILRQNIIDEFKGYIKTAFSDIVNDMAQDKINSLKSKLSVEISDEEPQEEDNNGIVTTEEELEGFFIVKSILAEEIQLSRIYARDTKSYFGILLDNSNRKWICRLHFNSRQKYIGFHGEEKEEKIAIDKIEDIYKYKDNLIKAAKRYFEESA